MPIFYRVLYIPRGCLGFRPSTVAARWKKLVSGSRDLVKRGKG